MYLGLSYCVVKIDGDSDINTLLLSFVIFSLFGEPDETS